MWLQSLKFVMEVNVSCGLNLLQTHAIVPKCVFLFPTLFHMLVLLIKNTHELHTICRWCLPIIIIEMSHVYKFLVIPETNTNLVFEEHAQVKK